MGLARSNRRIRPCWLADRGAILVFAFPPPPNRRRRAGRGCGVALDPGTVIWGYFAADAPPVLASVRADGAHRHRLQRMNTADSRSPSSAAAALRPTRCSDVIDIHRKVVHPRRQRPCPDRTDLCRRRRARRHAGGSHHRAEHGALRVNTNHGFGVLPDLLPGPSARSSSSIRAQRGLVLRRPGAPLHPFMGIMARRRAISVWSARGRPRAGAATWISPLAAGETLYLPVFNNEPVLHRRLARGAGRRRDRRDRHRGIADRDLAIHRAEGRRRVRCAGRARGASYYCAMGWTSISTSAAGGDAETVAFCVTEGLSAADAMRWRASRSISASPKPSMRCGWYTA